MDNFKALVVREDDAGVSYNIEHISLSHLNEGDILIRTEYSSVNYKDSLAVKHRGGIIRTYPMIPGIDVSGVVVASTHPSLSVNDRVFVTGYDLGVAHTGGYSEYVRVPHQWVTKLPDTLDTRSVMVLGTAGLTAGLSVKALEHMGMTPTTNPSVLVTGATGGVGSIAIQILSTLGYSVDALSRKKEQEHERLLALGAHSVVTMDELTDGKKRPLAKQRYHYIIDTVGGDVASQLIPLLYYGGSITLCGQVGGIELNTTVLPFILRGINLLGIDSVYASIEQRTSVWQAFASSWDITHQAIVHEITLEEIAQTFEALSTGTHVGRTIVRF